MRHLSLLAKIFLSTAGAVTTLFAGAGWFFEHQASVALRDSVAQEVRASLGTVDASLQSRVEHLSTASALLASMSDVRAAFGTHDRATIRDTAGELWTRSQAGRSDAAAAAFAVAAPMGTVLATVGGEPPSTLREGRQLPASLLDPARQAFPQQSAAFAKWDGAVWQVLATPVLVDSGNRAALLSILVAAHPITAEALRELKQRTGGSDFLLRSGGQTLLATAASHPDVVSHPEDYATHVIPLKDGEGAVLAELWAVRSFQPVEARIAVLRRNMIIAWVVAMTIGLGLSYLLASRIVRPIRALNDAAQQVSRENYSVRVPETSRDELGILAATFNHMSASIEDARAEQLRSSQIAAVGRLAASVAHDLRNPLSAIVGGSEMLAEFDLPADQSKQTATQIHNAARRMERLLSEIGQVARSEPGRRVSCEIEDLVMAAVQSQQEQVQVKNVAIGQAVEPGLMVKCERSRVERVFINLLANALEVLPDGGRISIEAARSGNFVQIDVLDNGPGVPVEIRKRLFQPFVTAGKTNGLGLGLALARQTMLDNGGDLELVASETGAHFRLRLPCLPDGPPSVD